MSFTNLGPVAVKLDTTSLVAQDLLNNSRPRALAVHQEIESQSGGNSEMFYHGSYLYGLSSEYAGLWEMMVEGLSVRCNFRYIFEKFGRKYGKGPPLWVGDRLDTTACCIQMVGTMRMDENDDYVINPETGQPYIDEAAAEITVRTFRGDEVTDTGGKDAGDLRFILRGINRRVEFGFGQKVPDGQGVPQNVIYGYIDKDGIHWGGVNLITEINSLKARVTALENP
jgi:hypothetical protein